MTRIEKVARFAAFMGCTPEQVKAQYAKNAKSLRWMADRARASANGMYRGGTAEHWANSAAEFEACASS